MIKLIIWSLLLLQLPWLSQCQDYDATKLRTFYSTFLDDSPIVSPYAVVEDEYYGYHKAIVGIDDFLGHIVELDINSNVTKIKNNARKILGDLQNLNKSIYHTEEGILRQLKFFHVRRISDADSYLLLRTAVRRNEAILQQARKAQAVVTEFDQLYFSCKKPIELLTRVFGNFKPLEDLNLLGKQGWFKANSWYFEFCNKNGAYAKKVLATHGALETKSYVMYRDALFLLFDTMVYALELSKAGEFNGQRAAPDNAQLGPIEQMWYETNKAGEEIEKGLKNIRAKSIRDPKTWKGVYDSLLDIIGNRDPDWDMQLLFLNQTNGLKVDDALKTLRKRAVDDLNNILEPAKDYLQRYNSIYKYDLTHFSREAITEDFKEKYWTTVEAIQNMTETVEINYREAAGKKNFIKTSPFQNLFLAWMEFNRLNAKIQCHLKNNYWDFHRGEALKKSQQPMWRVFGGISKTLYEPCVHNNTDLVGTCTAANHEICMPMKYTTEIMREMDEDEDTADTFLKPDYVFRPIYLPNGTMLCQETESYAVPLSLCRCGFRLDCGQDLGKNLTCVLQPNDNFRKQCKGSIGYPCKTLPFGPGRHHESCVTGYCNMRLNSCERDPTIYPLVYSGQHRKNEF